MLLAVIMGFEQSPRSVLSKRRWMRRLLLASFRRMIAFTRNPLVGSVLEKLDTLLNTGNHKGFRVSQKKLPPNAGDFACLRSSSVVTSAWQTWPSTARVLRLNIGFS